MPPPPRAAILALAILAPHFAAATESGRLKQMAAQITITRDDWGIAHVHGHTDAQAVFGMVYAQAEDDFNRIEMNYLTALGRLAEADGQGALMQDLRARLYIDPADLRTRYAAAPVWLKNLMDGWADGLNYYLETHPHVAPKVLRHFDPWMALAFSEGSIGGDIEQIPLAGLAAFYNQTRAAWLVDPFGADRSEPTGSNGIAIAPANTAHHHALLLINPHTSFYFRSELQMTSDEGLNAYGAATWGQFFLYQGFNPHLGWMHTSTTADAVDSYLETVIHRDGLIFARSGAAQVPVTSAKVTLSYRARPGSLATKTFTIYRTPHGPVVGRAADGRWISEAMMFRPVEALAQSFGLTKAADYAAYMKVMAWQANTSNNTVYADAAGHIAYLHPQFVPKRDDAFDYTHPVDGAEPRTAWQGPHALTELPMVVDPPTGWIQNTNNGPWSVSGRASPRRQDFPRYMDVVGENMRGLHASALLRDRMGFTLESLVAAAYDPGQPGFDRLVPPLLDAWDHGEGGDALRRKLAAPMAVLRGWDRRWASDSVATSLAVYWGEALWQAAGQAPHSGTVTAYDAVRAHSDGAAMVRAFGTAVDRLDRDFGTWQMPWGQINRFQRRTDDLEQPFSDAAPSLPVEFTSAQWGSLASITGAVPAGVKKRYGSSGNSFVAAVEFTDPVRAVAVSAGGESGDPISKHFTDQASRYATGALRKVYFTNEQLAGHIERQYHPGL
jgi:acyl-homoserine-lactone acylase